MASKLGYTWYPKDWGNSESVFELNLSERGLYRELIDLAMLNDNKTEVKLDVWSRKFAVDIELLKAILEKLSSLNLIKIKDDVLFIPSCESRLNLVRGGSKGGSKSKKNKPTLKPLLSLEQNNDKPNINQIENKTETESKNNIFFSELINSESWIETSAMQSKAKFKPLEVKEKLKEYNTMLEVTFDKKTNKNEYATHFIHWLNKQEKPKKDNDKKLLF